MVCACVHGKMTGKIIFVFMLQTASKKSKLIRDIVRDVVGYAPYEKRIMELLRIAKDKRALKFAKKRVSTDT